MSHQSGSRGTISFLLAAFITILACSISNPTPNSPLAFDPTKAALELQSTAMSLQLTQAAIGAQVSPTLSPSDQATLPPESQTTLPSPTLAETPIEDEQRFFTDEFDADVVDWTTFLTSGQQSLLEQYVENGFWVFNLGARQMWVYSLYEPQVYADVRIDVQAQNRGDNTNNISIICRYNEQEGWYEFNMYNSGLYDIFYGRWKAGHTDTTYLPVANGGSNAIRQGKASNDYTVICSGKTLSLFINGEETRTLNENEYKLIDGQVGIGASSFDRLPVRVDFDWVKISKP